MKKYSHENTLWERLRRAEIKGFIRNRIYYFCLFLFLFCMIIGLGYIENWNRQQQSSEELSQQKNEPVAGDEAENDNLSENSDDEMKEAKTDILPPVILPDYRKLYEQNKDMTGWLYIKDTVIDYPVMQTPEDETYYLRRDFYGEEDSNGCLIMDTDSVVGNGTAEHDYEDGTKPSTNLIIHGHTMKSGQMFGNLKLYADSAYGLEHSVICFDSLYEKREYELLAVFYSKVYNKKDDVFKYYKFFQADTQEEFDNWYDNIMRLSLYDTGATAEFGDEFITLSCCSYHTEDGRFVVVGKRVK